MEFIGQGLHVRWRQLHPELGEREGTGTVSHEYWVDGEEGRFGCQIATDFGFSVGIDRHAEGSSVEVID